MYPFVQSIIFSFNQQLTPTGYVLHYVGLDNYHNLLFVHQASDRLHRNPGQMLSRVPAVLIFSFLCSQHANQRFRAHYCQVVFSPVIMGAQAVLALKARITCKGDELFQNRRRARHVFRQRA